MKYIVAVSGGVDSVVLLDILARSLPRRLVVAHFDHGIREDSHQDAQFVAGLAEKYNLPFETKREELGADASEEYARERRYAFLRAVARQHDAVIATAHHADDVAETIAINFVRGTGWRGLAVLDSPGIERPLIGYTKQELLEYAKENSLIWREDSTNHSDKYLRNKLRHKMRLPDDTKRQLLALRARQCELKAMVSEEVKHLVAEEPEGYLRYFFIMIEAREAVEVLRMITQGLLTGPQLQRLLITVKTAAPGAIYQASKNIKVSFTSRHFTVELIH